MKLVEKFLRSPQNTRYSTIASLLTHFGWQNRGGKGSHTTWFKNGHQNLVFSLHGNDCPTYQKLLVAQEISKNL